MRVVFMGTPEFAVACLRKLISSGYDVVGVVTQPDKPIGRKHILSKSPVKELAEEFEIEVYQPTKIKDKVAIEYILSWNPEIIVTAAYGQIIPDELLEYPKYKSINVHASLLPKYRGAAPIHKAIINGEKETGVSIMYMVKELDAGDILTQRSVLIGDNDNLGTLYNKLSQVGADLLIETLELIKHKKIKPIIQDSDLVTYASILKREDELINWNMTSIQIYNHIRGLNPWPVAYTYVNNDVFKIWSAEPIDYSHQHEAGKILKVDKGKLYVATLDGAISLIEVQPFGKRKMDIISYLQGSKIKVGDKIGEKQ